MLNAFTHFVMNDIVLHKNSDYPLEEYPKLKQSLFVYHKSAYEPPQRRQINGQTAYLDLSQIYGSDKLTGDALRTKIDGQLRYHPEYGLPDAQEL